MNWTFNTTAEYCLWKIWIVIALYLCLIMEFGFSVHLNSSKEMFLVYGEALLLSVLCDFKKRNHTMLAWSWILWTLIQIPRTLRNLILDSLTLNICIILEMKYFLHAEIYIPTKRELQVGQSGEEWRDIVLQQDEGWIWKHGICK